jgi:hypothetical protein
MPVGIPIALMLIWRPHGVPRYLAGFPMHDDFAAFMVFPVPSAHYKDDELGTVHDCPESWRVCRDEQARGAAYSPAQIALSENIVRRISDTPLGGSRDPLLSVMYKVPARPHAPSSLS